MRQFRVTFFFLAVMLTLSGCGILGGSDGTDVTVAEEVAAQPTVNSVQAVPAQTPASTTDDGAAGQQPDDAGSADGALPTAVTLPTAAPTPEPTVDRSQPTTYIVKSGDVLGLIAERFDADIAELRRVNGLDGNLIRVGQELTIPALDGSTSSSDAAPAATSAPSSPSPTTAPAGPVSCGAGTGHCIQPGESLTGIAVEYGTTVDALRAANPGIIGDAIRSGQRLNLPDGTSNPAPAATTAPGTPAGTAVPAATVGPTNDAACKAANAQFPYYHAADGLCYANPIGATTIPTAVGGSTDTECPAGRFLWEDGLCYNIPGVTVTPTVGATPTSAALPDYGTVPCRDGYLPLESGRCWPEPETTPATVVPATQATATATSANTVACEEPNFTSSASGTCFLLQAGVDMGCTLEAGVPKCP